MGGRTILTYIVTTVFAVSIGLAVVNIIQPGKSITEETRTQLLDDYKEDAEKRQVAAAAQKETGPL